MAYTVEYSTTGQRGCDIAEVTIRYGDSVAKADAQRWLAQNPIPGAVIVPAVGNSYQVTWGRDENVREPPFPMTFSPRSRPSGGNTSLTGDYVWTDSNTISDFRLIYGVTSAFQPGGLSVQFCTNRLLTPLSREHQDPWGFHEAAA